jgi:hypothetical protein
MAFVYLPDSWVLAVDTDESHVSFVIEAVMRPEHPRYYSPPKPGEQYSYVRVRWSLHGDVSWNEGPSLEHPAIDQSGERDFGNIDAWWQEGDVEHLEGAWGTVRVRNAVHTVTYDNN